MTTITIPYTPRDAFRAYHQSPKRFGVTVAHRRAGKTVARINKLIRKAIECPLPDARFAYLAPFFVQAKDIAWLYLKHYAAPLLAIGGKINESELSIVLPNGATIRLYGAENAERMRGVYLDGVVIDEAQGVSPQVLTSVILPALADRQGWLDCSGTPKGWENLLGRLVKLARQNPDEWHLQILKASDTGILPADELARQKALLPDNEYEQEFECSFDAAITGAFYGKEMAAALTEGRITSVPYEPDLPVHTAWDLGFSDDTAIWFFQRLHGEMRFIDHYAANGHGVEHYASIIHGKGYNYGTHWLPHDALPKTMASGGKSIVEQLWALDVKGALVPGLSVQDGIQAVRMMLPRCWFDEGRCATALESLRQYQREWDDKLRVFRDKPKHDFTSHDADAFRYAAVATREPRASDKPAPVKFFGDPKQMKALEAGKIAPVTAHEVFWPVDLGEPKYERI